MRSDARVLVVGVGGLGCPAVLVLARAGVGTIAVCDDDVVDASNLHRQILFSESDVGKDKLDAAKTALGELAPNARLELLRTRILPDNAVDMVSRFDLVVEGSDNFATKFLVADACAIAKVAVVHGAAVRWHGTALAVGRHGRPCYRCLFEDIPHEAVQNCAEAGVMGPAVGVVAALQADLALRMIDGRDATGTLVTFDGKTGCVRRRTVNSRPSCILCGKGKTISAIDRSRYVGDHHGNDRSNSCPAPHPHAGQG
jgi:molybdopterin/thiamine biosynthesis adenylyltransferase